MTNTYSESENNYFMHYAVCVSVAVLSRIPFCNDGYFTKTQIIVLCSCYRGTEPGGRENKINRGEEEQNKKRNEEKGLVSLIT